MTNQTPTEERLREWLATYTLQFSTDSDVREKMTEDIVRHCLLAKQEALEEQGLYRYWEPCDGCKDGHPSIWKTLVESPQWKAWYDHASKNMLYDVDESQELGVMSPKHFQDFMRFSSQEAEKAVLEEILNLILKHHTDHPEPIIRAFAASKQIFL